VLQDYAAGYADLSTSVSGTSLKKRRTVLRIFAVISALMSCVAAFGVWAFIGFDRHYFPSKSIVPRYIELAVWSALALYFAVAAYFGSFKLWRQPQNHGTDR